MRILATSVFVILSGCGVFAQQKDYEALVAKEQADEKALEQQRAEIAALKGDLEATRQRLDNALRASADTGTDIITSKARLNELAGRLDETGHNVEQVRKDVVQTRTELDARIDEVKRVLTAQSAPTPPPVQISADKTQHYKDLDAAYTKKDWGLVRTLGHEYVTRYATDDKADDALFLVGDADLQDGKPSSALGEFNRLLKLYPRSSVLDRVLLDMGDAYLLLHDCENAKLAFGACESRFPKEKSGHEAKQKLAKIEKPAPGVCGPP
jgi:TolA-binding protein